MSRRSCRAVPLGETAEGAEATDGLCGKGTLKGRNAARNYSRSRQHPSTKPFREKSAPSLARSFLKSSREARTCYAKIAIFRRSLCFDRHLSAIRLRASRSRPRMLTRGDNIVTNANGITPRWNFLSSLVFCFKQLLFYCHLLLCVLCQF